jgi:hypothetical protein
MNAYTKTAEHIFEALASGRSLLPSFREQCPPSIAEEVKLALWERADRLEKAGDFEAACSANHAAVALGFERWSD